MSREIEGSIRDKALLTEEEGRFYTNMGRTNFRKWADEIGATRRRGRRVLFNREVIDNFLRAEGSGGDQDEDNQD
ncbi:MAG: hypothetical protein IJ639_03375 [Ruminococcus sp.]|nr:hypothetical protein [Ruminococcus sp.]MBR1873639.1 hypothetical protein [Eubacterium sp.]